MKGCRTITLGLAPALLAMSASAGEGNEPAPQQRSQSVERESAEVSAPGERRDLTPRQADGTAKDLQKIVVLCAADPTSAEFGSAWSAYVEKHRLGGEKLERTIRHVVNEAFRHRQQFGQVQSNRDRSTDWKVETSKLMHDTAMSIIRKIG